MYSHILHLKKSLHRIKHIESKSDGGYMHAQYYRDLNKNLIFPFFFVIDFVYNLD
jgi:hypothetical protein